MPQRWMAVVVSWALVSACPALGDVPPAPAIRDLSGPGGESSARQGLLLITDELEPLPVRDRERALEVPCSLSSHHDCWLPLSAGVHTLEVDGQVVRVALDSGVNRMSVTRRPEELTRVFGGLGVLGAVTFGVGSLFAVVNLSLVFGLPGGKEGALAMVLGGVSALISFPAMLSARSWSSVGVELHHVRADELPR